MCLSDPSPCISPALKMVVEMCLGKMNAALDDAKHAGSHRQKNKMMRVAVDWAMYLSTQVPKDEIQNYMDFDTFFHMLQVASLGDTLENIEKRDRVLHKSDIVRCTDKKKQHGLLQLMLASAPPKPGAGLTRHRAKASSPAHPYKAVRALKKAKRDAPRTSLSHDHAAGPDAEPAELDPAFLALFAKTSIEEAKSSPPDNHAANVDTVCEQLLAFHLPPKPAPSTLVARSNNHRQPLVGKPYARPAPKAKRA